MNVQAKPPAPPDAAETDSITARMAAAHVFPEPGTRHVRRFEQLRAVLRNDAMRQNGASLSPTEKEDPTLASIFFLHGDEHRRRRGAIIGFFTPKAIATRHMPIITETADRLIADFRNKGRARLDDMSFMLTSTVVAEIVGLTETPLRPMMRRIEMANGTPDVWRGGIRKLLAPLKSRLFGMAFFIRDVKPAIAARRKQRREDVISRLLDEGRSDIEILVECTTFGLAGMGTTREFVVVAALHLFENEDLRRRFLEGGDAEQMEILKEILRLEPQASMIYRTAAERVEGVLPETIEKGERLSLGIRAANIDEEAVGPNPEKIDPDRARKMKNNGAWMSFGDGAHFCPGWQVALTETRILLDRLFRVPGVRLTRYPDMEWTPPMLQSYQFVNAVIECDRA
ncbi:MAG: cytochrome P450 [Novosphingobium sp.]|nr:cytochrome P450 [Novosphingobium sp.]